MEIKMFSTVEIPTDFTVYKGRKIEYIVLHYSAGVTLNSSSALNVCKWWNKDPNKASADFVVDEESIWQYNPDVKNNYCWHGGGNKYNYKGGARLYGICKNSNSLSIELCSYRDDKNAKATAEEEGWKISDKVLQHAIQLVQYLKKEYNIPAENVISHFDITGKLCPRPFLSKVGDTWVLDDNIMRKFREEPVNGVSVADILEKYSSKHPNNSFVLKRLTKDDAILIGVTTDLNRIIDMFNWKSVMDVVGTLILVNDKDDAYMVHDSDIKVI